MSSVHNTPTPSPSAYTQAPAPTRQTEGAGQPAQPQADAPQGASPQPAAYGNDSDSTAKPRTYDMSQGDFKIPGPGEAKAKAPAQLQILDFDDDGAGYFDPGVQALERQVQQKQADNFEAMAEVGDKTSPQAQSGAAQDAQKAATAASTDPKGLNADDPAIQALLQKIREADGKNFKAMIDMIQKSLDRAHEMLEKNNKEYYQKTLPQLQAVQNQLKQMAIAQEGGQQADAKAAANRIGDLSHKIQQALTQNPQFATNAAAQNAVAALAAVAQGSSKAASN